MWPEHRLVDENRLVLGAKKKLSQRGEKEGKGIIVERITWPGSYCQK